MNVPPNELVQNLDVLLYVFHIGRILRIEDGKRRYGCAIVDVAPSGLKKASNKDDLEQGVCIFEKLESRACLNKFGSKRVKVSFWNCLEMFVKLVSEDWKDMR